MEGSSANSAPSQQTSHTFAISCLNPMGAVLTTIPNFLSIPTTDGQIHSFDMFAVYNGHGGTEVSTMCGRIMHVILADEAARSPLPATAEWWKGVMERTFARVDWEVLNQSTEEMETVGSTALMLLVGQHRIVVANCGDSRVVLYRHKKAIPLSNDHKPENESELQRIRRVRGNVIYWGAYRVMGALHVSRSIGDQYLKPWITSHPETTVNDRDKGDKFLVLGNVGFWSAVPNKDAGKAARRCLRAKAWGSPQQKAAAAAAALTKLAVDNGSVGHVTVVVVLLN